MHPTAVHRIESVVKNFKNRFVYIFLSIHRYVKLIFYKNNATLPIVIPNLHDSAPHFGGCLPEIWGQDRIVQISCGNRRLCVIYSYKKLDLVFLIAG